MRIKIARLKYLYNIPADKGEYFMIFPLILHLTLGLKIKGLFEILSKRPFNNCFNSAKKRVLFSEIFFEKIPPTARITVTRLPRIKVNRNRMTEKTRNCLFCFFKAQQVMISFHYFLVSKISLDAFQALY